MAFHVKHSVAPAPAPAPAPAVLFHIESDSTCARLARQVRRAGVLTYPAMTSTERWNGSRVGVAPAAIDRLPRAWFDESKLPGAPRGCAVASAQHAEIDRDTSGPRIGLAATITCSFRPVRDLDAHSWFDASAAACTDHDHVRVADPLPHVSGRRCVGAGSATSSATHCCSHPSCSELAQWFGDS
jgi:hypothetical protein